MTTAFVIAVPASAATLVAGSTGVAPTGGVPAGQGTLLASQVFSGQAFTFAATFNQAVYLNAAGTLDFYFQVIRTGAGSISNQEIRSFTISDFGAYLVDGYASALDPDGTGLFIAANNPNLANGTPSPSTTTFGRSPSGSVVTIEFGANGLTGTENSATYIFRTNATAYNNQGTFGIIDGSTLQGLTFQPIAAVPEPATWAMMLVGFGGIGLGMRRRKPRTSVSFA
ncbi:hypothetical protein ASG11_14275 [Sphingomonas sp. Leaf357]|nr:hypothetical protein ASG11_14275 [Sphingomonas sp. Leaf357]